MMLKRTGWIAAAMLGLPLIGLGQNTGSAAAATNLYKPVVDCTWCSPLIAIEHYEMTSAPGEVEFFKKLGWQMDPLGMENSLIKIGDNQYIMARGGNWNPAPLKPGELHVMKPATAGQLVRDNARDTAARAFRVANPQFQQKGAFGHFGFLTTNVSAVYAAWKEASLNPTKVHLGVGNTLESEADNPEVIAHAPGSDHAEALEYIAMDPQFSSQVTDRGKYLNPDAVSHWLLGFEYPVDDLPMWEKYYEKIGLTTFSTDDGKVWMSPAGNPDLLIILRRALPGETYMAGVHILLKVPDAAKAADQLRSAGLEAVAGKNQVSTHDPAGLEYVFMQR